MKNKFDNQVQEFHHEMVELIKKYQFRDRNQMTCCGISVSQCYILETLHRFGNLTMKKLADKMHLSISTVTRVIEPLVKKGLVTREQNQNDRRIRLISLTDSGESVFQESWQKIFESEKIIINNFPEENRSMLIELLRKLNYAVSQWQSCYMR